VGHIFSRHQLGSMAGFPRVVLDRMGSLHFKDGAGQTFGTIQNADENECAIAQAADDGE